MRGDTLEPQKQKDISGAPDRIRTCDLCLRRADVPAYYCLNSWQLCRSESPLPHIGHIMETENGNNQEPEWKVPSVD